MSSSSEYSIGTITATEGLVVIRPKNYTAAKRGIIYVHGVETAAGGAVNFLSFTERNLLLRKIAAAGHIIISCDAGGNSTWGNDTLVSRLTAAKTYLLSLGVLPTKVALIGTSMGALNSLVWAKQNLASVSCVVGIIPMIDLTDAWANRGFASEINTAYGGTYSEATYGAVHSPKVIAAAGGFGTLPIQLWYGDTDTTAIPSAVTTFKTAVGSSCEIHLMSGGHSESIVSQVDVPSVLSFITSAG